MGELEASCARLAAQRMSPAERVNLEFVHRRSLDAVRGNDTDSYRTVNFEFHDVIYRGAHNEFLLATTVGIRQRIAPFRRAQFAIPDRLARSHDEHDAIVAAILQGDGERASAVMRTHVNFVRAASRDYVFGLELTAPGPIMPPGGAGAAGHPTPVCSAAVRLAVTPQTLPRIII